MRLLFRAANQCLAAYNVAAIASSKTFHPPANPWPEFAPRTYIRSGKQMVAFVPYRVQVRLIELIEQYRGAVIVKTRQLGITEAIANYFLKKATENPAYAAVIFSKTQDDASNISRRVSGMASTAAIVLASDSATRIATPDGAQLFFRPSTDDAARGLESIHDLLFDESAFPRNVQQIYGAASPTQNMLGDDARTVFVSTPNGRGGFFWTLLNDNNPEGIDILKIAQQVRDGKLYCDDIPGFYWFVDESGWVKIFIHWRSHPIYSQIPDYLSWVKKRDKLDEATLQQEHNLGFEETSGAVFATDLIDRALRGSWQKPQTKHRYLMGVDTNLGGGDYFVAAVLDVTDGRPALVAMYRNNYQTSDYNTEKTLALFDLYHPFVTSVELNNGGLLYLDEFIRMRPAGQFEGVNTNRSSKPVNIGRLKLLLERDMLILPDEGIIREEFRDFTRYPDKTMEAAPGGVDDIVMALAVACTQVSVNIPTFAPGGFSHASSAKKT